MTEAVNHPDHYGGKDNPYEAIKVIDAWNLSFCLGNALKYISRAGRKPLNGDLFTTQEAHDEAVRKGRLQDLRKARWYLDHEIELTERQGSAPPG